MAGTGTLGVDRDVGGETNYTIIDGHGFYRSDYVSALAYNEYIKGCQRGHQRGFMMGLVSGILLLGAALLLTINNFSVLCLK